MFSFSHPFATSSQGHLPLFDKHTEEKLKLEKKKKATWVCGLKELRINNLSHLLFLSIIFLLFSAQSFSLFDLSSSALYSIILYPCRGWSGFAVCPSAPKGVRGGAEGAAVLEVEEIGGCFPWPSCWWWPWWLTLQQLKSRELAVVRKKCQSWTLRWSWDAHATSQIGTSGLCGAKRIQSTSMWSHCWSTRLTRKASSPTCATWCQGPRSTEWCSGTALTKRPSPRFWILFPRRRSYPSWAFMEGRPWSWLIRYGGLTGCMTVRMGSEWKGDGWKNAWLWRCFWQTNEVVQCKAG